MAGGLLGPLLAKNVKEKKEQQHSNSKYLCGVSFRSKIISLGFKGLGKNGVQSR